MKSYNILVLILLSTSLFAQKYENIATFDDKTKIKFTVIENNPLTHPNLLFNLNFEISTLPTSNIVAGLCLGIQYSLPKIGKIELFAGRGTGYPNMTTNTRSDNFDEDFHTKFGANIGVYFWNKNYSKEKKLNLKNKGNRLQYVTPYSHNFRMSLAADAGYTRMIAPVSNFLNEMSSDSPWHLTDNNGYTLVPNNHPDLNFIKRIDGETDGANFHTIMHSDILHLGVSFQHVVHMLTLTNLSKKPRRNMTTWGAYIHLLYAPNILIEPIIINRDKEISVTSSSSQDVYITTVPIGVYNVQHNNPGGFVTESLGFRLGMFTSSNFVKSVFGSNVKLEGGILPGITNYNRGDEPFATWGRVYVSLSIGIRIGCYLPRFDSKYGM